ncbi:MAG: hypothetical protein JNL01_11640 [Bdellovibrionales bacterium]|nr:hypothetical protein [Bdellovibrionales bacterium]
MVFDQYTVRKIHILVDVADPWIIKEALMWHFGVAGLFAITANVYGTDWSFSRQLTQFKSEDPRPAKVMGLSVHRHLRPLEPHGESSIDQIAEQRPEGGLLILKF